MSDQELYFCSFCKLEKPVGRHYVRAGNKELDGDKQNVSVIVYYCQDCGIEKGQDDTAGSN